MAAAGGVIARTMPSKIRKEMTFLANFEDDANFKEVG